MESKAYSYNSEELKKVGKSLLLALTGAAAGFIALGAFPAISLLFKLGDFSIDLIPLISAGFPFIVNAIRLFVGGNKVD